MSMSTTLTAPVTARTRITAALAEAGWTLDEQDSSPKALRASKGKGRWLIVYFSGAFMDKAYAFSGGYDGTLTRYGNIAWLVEHVIAFINNSDTVVVPNEFAMLVDGEPMGTYDNQDKLGQAVIAAYAAGAVRVEIVRAV